ncbi:hypothetical protein Tco_1017622 [Tanacetum coccineum]|uniref:Uncharacterized protein n=1 Tax=Tanacetum coccineum TaxID=301880 RepID=A0ABQ5FUL1_9ASTR
MGGDEDNGVGCGWWERILKASGGGVAETHQSQRISLLADGVVAGIVDRILTQVLIVISSDCLCLLGPGNNLAKVGACFGYQGQARYLERVCLKKRLTSMASSGYVGLAKELSDHWLSVNPLSDSGSSNGTGKPSVRVTDINVSPVPTKMKTASQDSRRQALEKQLLSVIAVFAMSRNMDCVEKDTSGIYSKKFPHHGIDRWLQIQIFYDHVSFHLYCEIDRAVSGKLRNKNTDKSWELIENLALYDHEGWDEPIELRQNGSKPFLLPQGIPKTLSDEILELEDQINFLLKGS